MVLHSFPRHLSKRSKTNFPSLQSNNFTCDLSKGLELEIVGVVWQIAIIMLILRGNPVERLFWRRSKTRPDEHAQWGFGGKETKKEKFLLLTNKFMNSPSSRKCCISTSSLKWNGWKLINDLNPPVTAVHNGSRGDVYPVELFVWRRLAPCSQTESHYIAYVQLLHPPPPFPPDFLLEGRGQLYTGYHYITRQTIILHFILIPTIILQ